VQPGSVNDRVNTAEIIGHGSHEVRNLFGPVQVEREDDVAFPGQF
jgi:hypothetical protein